MNSQLRASIMKDQLEKTLSSTVYKWNIARKASDHTVCLKLAKVIAECSAELVKDYETLASTELTAVQ